MTNTLFDQPTEDELPRLTGTALVPLFTWRGRDVYPVYGAEGDDDPSGTPDGEPEADEDDDAGEGDPKAGEEPVSRAEFDKLRKQLSAADKNRAAAEKRLKDIDDAKKDELTKVTERAEAAEKQVAAQNKELADMRLQNAFLMADTDITWHDPADALALAERQGYLDEVVGEDGKVDKAKLGSKLKELAKAKPHLVNGTTAENGKAKEEDKPKTPTGSKVGSKGAGGNKAEDKVPSRYDKFLR